MNKLTPLTALAAGAHTLIPLRCLLKSPRNARKMAHSTASIESKAASIAAKGILQNLVVEPERDAGDQPTGRFFVTIGEGRRLAQWLRVERGEITDEEPIPCVIDLNNNPQEISLDENVTREAMHPADQFEAFRALNTDQNMSADDIAARFGVSAKTVQQRLRLGAASPTLMAAYRADELNLTQLMAFCLTDDHIRQDAVFDRLPDYQRTPYDIRRALTEKQVPSGDRRARFVGADAYLEAGGLIDRDLFSDADGGYFTDPDKLTHMVLDRLTAMALALQDAEGWKWCEAHVDFPHDHGYRRIYTKAIALTEADAATLQSARDELMALSLEYEDADELPDAVDARMTELEQEITRLDGLTRAYDPEDMARGGIILSLDYHGQPRYERGLIRMGDLQPHTETDGDEDRSSDEGDDDGDGRDDPDAAEARARHAQDRPLSDALVKDLTAQRTLALRLTLGEQPELAARVLVHSLALTLFYHSADAACLALRIGDTSVGHYIVDASTCQTADALAKRHEAWAQALPERALDLWDYIMAIEAETLGNLMAHCAAATVCAVRLPFDRSPGVRVTAERLATAATLDMTEHWQPTVRSYLGRVNKEHILTAVREAVSKEAADRIASFKKPAMADEAERLVSGSGWLPPLLRTARPVDESEDDPNPIHPVGLGDEADLAPDEETPGLAAVAE